jgi:hypothetical protein
MRRWKKIIFATVFFVAATAAIICIRRFDPGQSQPPHHVSHLDLSAAPTDAQPIPGGPAAGFASAPGPGKSFRASRPHLADDEESLMLAAGAIKLWEPQALNQNQQLAMAASRLVMWNPKTPADFVRGCTRADPSLVSWLVSWQQRISSGKSIASASIKPLESALEKSRLTSSECMQATRLLESWEDANGEGDIAYPPVCGAFACQSIFAAASEVKGDVDHHSAIVRSVSPLICRLWEGRGEHLRAVEQFYSLLADYEPKGSADWLRGCTGRIEAMSMQLHYDQALAAVADLEQALPEVTREQRAAVSYSKGMTLFGAERYAEAVPALRDTAEYPSNGNHLDAQALLAIALARTNNVTDARKECELMEQSSQHSILFTSAMIALHAAENATASAREIRE